jgi:hypothetical protein
MIIQIVLVAVFTSLNILFTIYTIMLSDRVDIGYVQTNLPNGLNNCWKTTTISLRPTVTPNIKIKCTPIMGVKEVIKASVWMTTTLGVFGISTLILLVGVHYSNNLLQWTNFINILAWFVVGLEGTEIILYIKTSLLLADINFVSHWISMSNCATGLTNINNLVIQCSKCSININNLVIQCSNCNDILSKLIEQQELYRIINNYQPVTQHTQQLNKYRRYTSIYITFSNNSINCILPNK